MVGDRSRIEELRELEGSEASAKRQARPLCRASLSHVTPGDDRTSGAEAAPAPAWATATDGTGTRAGSIQQAATSMYVDRGAASRRRKSI